MAALEPVDYDPFASMVPVDHDPFFGVPQPTEFAQDKFNKIADSIVSGIRHWVETPGKLLSATPESDTGPMTEGEAFRLNSARDNAANWSAGTAFGMLGVGTPAGMLGPKGAVGAAGGKLGGALPMDEASRMARAREMGFDTSRITYHGSPDARGIDQGFKSTKERLGMRENDPDRAFFFADDYRVAKSYADDHRAFDYQNAEPAVVPAYLKMQNPKLIDWEGKKWRGTEKMIEEAKASGHDGVIIRNVIDTYQGDGKPTTVRVVFNPEQIRKPQAVFDPAKKDSGMLLAAGNQDAKQAVAGQVLQATSEPQGIRAYHGSPHDFDRFDLSKIGTGEGAQAYGHGLYFAEAEPVAKQYRDALAGQAANPARNSEMGELARIMSQYEVPGKYRQYRDPRGFEAAKRYDELMEARAADKGHMYEVNIGAKPEQFLDWDKPLSQQPKQIQEMVGNIPAGVNDPVFGRVEFAPPTGAEAYNKLAKQYGGIREGGSGDKRYPIPYSNEPQASAVLRDAGVPGIRYLDQGSRGSGMGTSNYVVFDPGIIEILRKYGLAGLSALPPATAAFIKDRLEPVDHDPFQ